MKIDVRNLLWLDGLAGLVVGLVVLALSEWLSQWYGLPRSVVLFTAFANLLYATFSLNLASRQRRSATTIACLAVANIAWMPVCFSLAYAYWIPATLWGVGHLIAEGIFVATLGVIEWRLRFAIAKRR